MLYDNTQTVPGSLDAPDPLETDIQVDTGEDDVIRRNVDDVLQEIKGHLTKEEQLCVSLYKNASGQRNTIHRVFLQKYHGKYLSSCAITKRKKKMFSVLAHIGELLRFKKENDLDDELKDLLTSRQFEMLMLYERRRTEKEITSLLDINRSAMWRRYDRALERLKNSEDPNIHQYLVLFNNILKFSRKFPKKKK